MIQAYLYLSFTVITIMNDQEIYQKIGELLWSIMPEEAKEIYFIGDIYPEHYSGGIDWLLTDGKVVTFPFGESPYEIERQIYDLMHELQSKDIFNKKWTNYKVILTNEGKFNIEFAYVPEEDHWPNLYMKAVSDLKKEELDEYNIPLDEWEKRVKLKNQS